MAHFNLINDDWILVSQPGGASRKVGIRALLNDAVLWQSIYGATPLETAAIYRLLIAFIHAAYSQSPRDIADVAEWKRAWQQKSFAGEIINGYCDKYEQRFNLFDPERPFYQDPQLVGKPESVSSLMTHIASGADATLFSHNTQASPIQFSLDQAARALVTIQAFGLCGTKGSTASFYDAPCARGVTFFVEGDTLFETLMLNLFERDLRSYRLRQREGDRPAWEQTNPFASDPNRPYGLLDHLTWHNRRILLVEPKDGNDMVTQMIYAPGLKSSDKAKSVRDVFNPFHHWIAKTRDDGSSDQSDRSHSPLVFKQDKALWRDSMVLFELPSDEDGRDKPPASLSWVRILAMEERIIPLEMSYRLLAIGACTKPGQDKTFFYRIENLPLPVEFLTNKDCVNHLGRALELAEKTGKLLNRCAFLLAYLILAPATPSQEFEEQDKPFDEQERIDNKIKSGQNPKSQDRRAQQAHQLFLSFGVERLYWSQLEAHFYRLVQDLPGDPEAAKKAWRERLERAARVAFGQAMAYAGADRRAQRAIVKAAEQFDLGLAQVLNV